ncbi:hypothetical protein OH76DRAFT_1557067 [Lentinus brumalis]|uniref:F-box domain-containing protein n=1 Tax=Lentinus brumalis TaxID=2498619 RepID=A0A371D7K3_9APHY|nr:hypothetical protein OH76DRAFT_1557067 [Polyporus brumalis]
MPSCIGRWRRIKREVKSPSPQTPVELVVPSPPSPRPTAETGELSAVDGTRTLSVTPAVDLRLPIELWRRVFEYARIDDRYTLAQLLRLHPALLSTAESVLYTTITLVADTSVVKLSESISSSPRLAKLVRELHVLAPIAANPTALELACLLRFLPELDYLTLSIAGVWRPEPWWDFAKCVDILAARFAHLRSLTTAGPTLPSTERGVPDFIRGHSSTLRELDLRNARTPTPKASGEPYKKIFLPELRVLVCHPRMIWEQFRVTERLKGVGLTDGRTDYLLHLSTVVGAHLVSLCIQNPCWARDSQGPQGWSLADVAERFPRLRYLQVNREIRSPTSSASIGNYPVDWQSDPPESSRRSTGRLTVVWVHESWTPFDISWDEIASRALITWSAYLDRVSYRYADGPFVTVSWNGKGQVVRAEDWEMGEDSWKLVT